jgi:hypothetical protein
MSFQLPNFGAIFALPVQNVNDNKSKPLVPDQQQGPAGVQRAGDKVRF